MPASGAVTKSRIVPVGARARRNRRTSRQKPGGVVVSRRSDVIVSSFDLERDDFRIAGLDSCAWVTDIWRHVDADIAVSRAHTSG